MADIVNIGLRISAQGAQHLRTVSGGLNKVDAAAAKAGITMQNLKRGVIALGLAGDLSEYVHQLCPWHEVSAQRIAPGWQVGLKQRAMRARIPCAERAPFASPNASQASEQGSALG